MFQWEHWVTLVLLFEILSVSSHFETVYYFDTLCCVFFPGYIQLRVLSRLSASPVHQHWLGYIPVYPHALGELL